MKKSKILSLILAAVMCLGAIPLSFGVAADEGPDPLVYTDLYESEGLIVDWKGYGSTAGALPTVDALNNAISSAGSNAVLENGYMASKGDKISVAVPAAELLNKSATYEIVYGFESPAASANTYTDPTTTDEWRWDQESITRIHLGPVSIRGGAYTTDTIGDGYEAGMFAGSIRIWKTSGSDTQWVTKWNLAKATPDNPDFGMATLAGEISSFVYIRTIEEGMAHNSLFTSVKEISSVPNVTYTASIDSQLDFGNGMNMKIFAFRVYADELTLEQRNQNHFADLAGYSEADLTGLERLDPEAQADLYAAYSTVRLSQENLKTSIEEDIAEAVAAIYTQALENVAPLYVQEGLIVNLMGYYSDASAPLRTTDLLGNAITYGSATATMGDGYIANKGGIVSVAVPAGQLADKDATYELVFGYEEEAAIAHAPTNNYASPFTYINQLNICTSVAKEPTQLSSGTGEYAGMGFGVLRFVWWNPNDGGVAKDNHQWYKDVPDMLATPVGEVSQITYMRHLDVLANTFKFSLSVNGQNTYEVGTFAEASPPAGYDNYDPRYDGRLQFGGKLNMEILAVRVYNRELTTVEQQQNHFADLLNYHEVDATAFLTLSEARKADLYEAFANTKFTETDATALKGAIDTAVLAQGQHATDVAGVLDSAAAALVQFDGFQARLSDYAGLRSRYTIDVDADLGVEGLTVVEIGAIMARADTFERDQMTLDAAKDAGTAGIVSRHIYNTTGLLSDNVFTDEADVTHFALTATFDGEYGKADYEKTVMARAYVVLQDYDGNEYVRYIEAVGTTNFTDGVVSMLSVCNAVQAAPDYVTNNVIEGVIAACAVSE